MTFHCYVGSNTTLKGNLECRENFLVEGNVEGDLSSEGLILLGKDAAVKGEVSAKEAAISGIVVGTVRCSAKLEIYESAIVIGTIQTPVLVMASGAQIDARIIMSGKVDETSLISPFSEDTYPALIKAGK
ncbi:MAG: polymer-forming cytoskeletal protein [Deltaproteobacteria bacterium]|jgi:cytoskeletal protein CcmA (bactofilin family)